MRVIKIKDYRRQVSENLLKAADLDLRLKVVSLVEDANTLLDKVKMKLSFQEGKFVRQSLATRDIPYSKLLIKDNKTINQKGESPKRLVIPATEVTATFSKIGYLGIKRCLDNIKVNYSRVSIVQASDLKERLEELKINRDEVTIASVEAINMYPYIKLQTTRKAVNYFAR